MGNVVQSKIEPLLKQYTYNYQNQQLKLSLLKGSVEVDNLILNDQEINKNLKAKNSPFCLRFGVLKRFQINLSVISRKFQNLNVDSLILIVGENEVSKEDLKMSQDYYEKQINQLFQNMKSQDSKTGQPKYDDPQEYFQEFQNKYEGYIKDEELKKKKKAEQEEKDKLKENQEKMNIFGVELLDTIKNLLDCKIQIENIYIVYENNLDFLYTRDNIDLTNFNFTIYLKQFVFQSNDLRQHCVDGVFKNYMNLQKFQEQSGIIGQANTAYWSLNIESFQILFGSGNFQFYDSSMSLENKTPQQMSEIIAIFINKFQRNKSFSFDLINLQQQAFDIILFYKDTSQIPLNAVFMNFEIKKLLFNFKIQKVELLLDIIAHYNNIGLIDKFKFIKPKVPSMSGFLREAFAEKYGLTSPTDSKILKRVNYYLIQERFLQVYWLKKYGQYVSYGVEEEKARVLLIKKYIKKSNYYKLKYGGVEPQWLQNLSWEQIVQEVDDRKEIKVEEKKQDSSPGAKMAQLRYKIDNEYIFKVMSKIHFHLRAGLNLQVLLFSRKNQTIDQSLEVENLLIDFLKPTGDLKINVMVQLVRFNLSASNLLFPEKNVQKMSIFTSKTNNHKPMSNSMINTSGQPIVDFSNMALQFEIQFQRAKSGNVILLIYSQNQIGQFDYNYYPVVFFNLMRNFIDVQKCINKNFRIKFETLVKKETSKLPKDIRAKVGMKSLIKESERQVIQLNEEKKTQNIYDIAQEKKKQEKNLEAQLEELNYLLQQVIISVKGTTQPITIKIFDKTNTEQIQMRYNSQALNFDVDLVSKGFISISAFGMEIKSQRSIQSLQTLLKNLLADVDRVKRFHKNELERLQQEDFENSIYGNSQMVQTSQMNKSINLQNSMKKSVPLQERTSLQEKPKSGFIFKQFIYSKCLLMNRKTKTQKISLIILIAFMQGALEFYQLAMFYFYKDDLNISISNLSLIHGFIHLPWILKPFFGFIIDSFPLFGYSRKGYILLVSIIELCGFIILSCLPKQSFVVVITQFVNVICLVVRNIIGEAMLVEVSQYQALSPSKDQQAEAQENVSLFFGSKSCGALVFSYLGGFSLEFLSKAQIFRLCLIFPLCIIIKTLFFFKEVPSYSTQESGKLLQKFYSDVGTIVRVIMDPQIKSLLLIVIFMISAPNLGPTFNYYFTEHLKFTPEVMGEISFVSSLAYLMGIISLNIFFKGVNFKKFYLTTSLINALMASSSLILLFNWNRQLNINDKFFCLSNSAVQNFISEINFLPLLALCCRFCPQNLEGTTYAVFTAIFNFAGQLSTLSGSLMVMFYGINDQDFSQLWKIVVFQTIYTLLGVILLGFVRFPKQEEQTTMEDILNQSMEKSFLSEKRKQIIIKKIQKNLKKFKNFNCLIQFKFIRIIY